MSEMALWFRIRVRGKLGGAAEAGRRVSVILLSSEIQTGLDRMTLLRGPRRNPILGPSHVAMKHPFQQAPVSLQPETEYTIVRRLACTYR